MKNLNIKANEKYKNILFYKCINLCAYTYIYAHMYI